LKIIYKKKEDIIVRTEGMISKHEHI